MNSASQIPVRVIAADLVASNIKRFKLQSIGPALPSFSAGSHVVVSMKTSERMIKNPYSLMGVSDPSIYEISVLRTSDSRGGSQFMHDEVKVGDELSISTPVNLFPISASGRKHILIAGGIGITPFVSMIKQLNTQRKFFQLHYAMRSADAGAYAIELQKTYPGRVFIYRDDQKESVDLNALLKQQPLGTHLYVCGPEGMINWVLKAGLDAGWPKESLHAERFLAPPSGMPFDVKLIDTGLVVHIDEHQSILEAVEAAGVNPPFLCRGGACGQCETSIVSFDGDIIHNDSFLTAEEKAARKKIMICVSRLKGRELALKL